VGERGIVRISQRRVTKRTARELRREAENGNDSPATGETLFDGLLGCSASDAIENFRDRVVEKRVLFFASEAQSELGDCRCCRKSSYVVRELVPGPSNLE
jgi:hypothetical protein